MNSNILFKKDLIIEKEYSRVLILCVMHGIDTNYDMFHKLDKEIIEQNKYKYILVESRNMNILKNRIFKELCVVFNQIEILQYFNHNKIKLTDDELLVPLIFLKVEHVHLLLRMYEYSYQISDYEIVKDLNKFFNLRFSNSDLLYNAIMANNYKYNNTKIDIDNEFANRSFKKFYKINDIIDIDYFTKKIAVSKFMNIGIKYVDHFYYKLNSKLPLDELHIILTSQDRFTIIKKLMLHPKYFYLMLRNTELFKYYNEYLNNEEFKETYRQCWRQIVLYEYKLKNKSIKDICVFDLETASKLPVFDLETNYTKSPYYSLTVNNANIVNFMDFTLNTDKFIASLDEFKLNFNIFISGNANLNLLENIDFTNKFAISGSIIPACVQLNHPYKCHFSKIENNKISTRLSDYFDYYYGNSDIDVMCQTKNDNKFIDDSNYFYTQLKTKLKENTLKRVLVSTYLFVNDNFLSKTKNLEIHKFGSEYLNSDEVKRKLYFYYMIEKLKYNKHAKHSVLKKFCSLKDLKIVLLNFRSLKNLKEHYHLDVNCVDNSICFMKQNVKVKIMSHALKRNFELFTFKDESYIDLVNHFHLNLVRGYYDGKSVYLLPSAITSYMTYICMDYKYFAGTVTPKDIIWKYYNRGYYTVLNAREMKELPNEELLFFKKQEEELIDLSPNNQLIKFLKN